MEYANSLAHLAFFKVIFHSKPPALAILSQKYIKAMALLLGGKSVFFIV